MEAGIEQTIYDIASRQHGIVIRQQLMRAGASCKVIKARVASRRLRPVFRGVYQAGPILSPETRHLAAVLACGPGACLSHHSAAVGSYQVDFLFRTQKVIVEVDGFAFHSSKRMFERDRSRDGDLQSRGFRILRITWQQLAARSGVVLARLARTLALAELAND